MRKEDSHDEKLGKDFSIGALAAGLSAMMSEHVAHAQLARIMPGLGGSLTIVGPSFSTPIVTRSIEISPLNDRNLNLTIQQPQGAMLQEKVEKLEIESTPATEITPRSNTSIHLQGKNDREVGKIIIKSSGGGPPPDGRDESHPHPHSEEDCYYDSTLKGSICYQSDK